MYPRNRYATISGRNMRRYSIAHGVIQRPQHQHSRSSLRHSNGQHPSMMPQHKAAAECPRCFMHPLCPRYRCATISGRSVRRYSIAQAVIQRPQHQHPHCSLQHSICRRLIVVPQCKAAAECLRSFMHPICRRNRCAAISGRNMRRYSIAQAVIQRPRHQHPHCSLRHSICLHPSMMPQCKAAA